MPSGSCLEAEGIGTIDIRVLRAGCHDVLICDRPQEQIEPFFGLYAFSRAVDLDPAGGLPVPAWQPVVILPGRAFLHPAGCRHVYIHFDLPALAATPLAGVPAALRLQHERVRPWLRSVARLLLQGGGAARGCRADVIALATLAAGLIVPQVGGHVTNLDPVVRNAIAAIEEHLHRTLAVADVAASMGVSTATCNRRFHEQLGCSPMQYLMQRRVQRAARLLYASDDSIEGVAEACGLGNRQYLSRMMRRFWQISPAAYRRQSRAGREV